MPNIRNYGKHTPFTIDLSFFKPSKCKIPYPHDFPDTPCKKCNYSWKNEIGNWLCIVLIAGLLILAITMSL